MAVHITGKKFRLFPCDSWLPACAKWLNSSIRGQMCTTHRELLHNWWSFIATGDQPERDEINVWGSPCWNMSGFRPSNKQAHTAFHIRIPWGNSCIWKAQLHMISTCMVVALTTRVDCLHVDREDFHPQLIWPFHWSSSKVQIKYWRSSIDNSLGKKKPPPKPNPRLCPEQKPTTREDNRADVKYVVGKQKGHPCFRF